MLDLQMKKVNEYSLRVMISSIIIACAFISFSLCLAAELNKSKKSDLRFDGKLCYLPQSSAFRLGIAALISLSIAQITGTIFVCRKLTSDCKATKPSFPCILMAFSWMSFGFGVAVMGGATSMSRSQPFGEGWLDGECYLVKDGVYISSALLGLVALGSSFGSAAISMKQRRQTEEDGKVHAQLHDSPSS